MFIKRILDLMNHYHEKMLLAQIEVDYLPLNDFCREIMPDTRYELCNQSQIEIVIQELELFITDHNLSLVIGPEMKPTISLIDTIQTIRNEWLEGNYEKVSYMYWLDSLPLMPLR